MSDKLHRFFLGNLHIRGEWVSLKESWQEIQKNADYPPAVRQVLGEALAAVSLLAESLKFDGSLVLQIQGTQPVTMLVVQASSEGTIRGIAKWKNEVPDNATFQALFGAGTMVISIENNPKPGANRGERYQSLVSLEGDSLADCLKAYFAQSEQLETQLWFAVNDDTISGLMLQSIPSDDPLTDQEDNWNHASILADTVTQDELLRLDVEDLLHRLYHKEELRLYESKPINFECSCSQEKIESTVHALGETDANALLNEQGAISVDCEFCNRHYALDKVDIARIFSNAIVAHLNDDRDGKGVIH